MAAIIALMFILTKILEAKFVKKEPWQKGRDGFLVYVAALAGLYIGELFMSPTLRSGAPGAYTDAPEF